MWVLICSFVVAGNHILNLMHVAMFNLVFYPVYVALGVAYVDFVCSSGTSTP